jgi:hypothetical protein
MCPRGDNSIGVDFADHNQIVERRFHLDIDDCCERLIKQVFGCGHGGEWVVAGWSFRKSRSRRIGESMHMLTWPTALFAWRTGRRRGRLVEKGLSYCDDRKNSTVLSASKEEPKTVQSTNPFPLDPPPRPSTDSVTFSKHGHGRNCQKECAATFAMTTTGPRTKNQKNRSPLRTCNPKPRVTLRCFLHVYM